MNSGELFRKTMPFCVAKLVVGAVTVLASVVLLLILMGIGWLFGESGMGFAILIWIGATGVIRLAIMHYFGYLIKAGHIAVIAEAVTTGKVPNNQVEYGKEKVKKRFATSNIYFAVDKLVTGSVKQIQRGIEKLGNKLDFIPGMESLTGLVNFFVELSLGYIDECCLGYTFYKEEQGAFKSACDGVVIYAQNIKELLKNAAKTMLKVLGFMAIVVLVVFVPIGLLFKILHWNSFIAFLLAIFVAWVVKFAFLDSYILCQTMTSYMSLAPNTQITFDLYDKLSKISQSFKKLYNEGKKEVTTAVAGVASAANANTATPQTANVAVEGNVIFCGHCGAKNQAGAGFCGSCGQKI